MKNKIRIDFQSLENVHVIEKQLLYRITRCNILHYFFILYVLLYSF